MADRQHSAAPTLADRDSGDHTLRVWNGDVPGAPTPDITIIIVSYNTKDLTLKCIETLLDCGGDVLAEVIVYDNASKDGSPDAIARAFPKVQLIASSENAGFAMANNIVAAEANAPYLLLLNPDTETYEDAIVNLLTFAKANPEGGIYGGRTYFPNGDLNPFSCCNEITMRSMTCRVLGLDKMFPGSEFCNSEQIGGWERDTVRHVDIVIGCFFLISKSLWDKLDGFDTKYFMYGEEADLCHRARKMGYRPMITPDARIMHLVGASTGVRADKIQLVACARVTLIREYWPAWKVPIGVFLVRAWVASRFAISWVMVKIGRHGSTQLLDTWRMVWRERKMWLRGY